MILDSSTTWSTVNHRNILTNVKNDFGRIGGSTNGDVGVELRACGTLNGRRNYGDHMTHISIGIVKVAEDIAEPLLRVQDLEQMNFHGDVGIGQIYHRKSRETVAVMEEDEYCLPFLWIYRDYIEAK